MWEESVSGYFKMPVRGETALRNDTPERDIVSDISKQQLRLL
jgi:hypothetical protein